jgi:quercetin dioxygenase-like cupin family protein
MNAKRNIYKMTIAIMAVVVVSCNQSGNNKSVNKMSDESNLIFPKGNKITNNNFTGSAWLTMLAETDTVYDTQIGSVTFEPGARTNWHSHPGGQILLVTQGKGLYQEKGQPIQFIQKGDVIKCPPNIIHWHGATPADTMVHIAIGPNTDKGSVVWLDKVKDDEYNDSNQ